VLPDFRDYWIADTEIVMHTYVSQSDQRTCQRICHPHQPSVLARKWRKISYIL